MMSPGCSPALSPSRCDATFSTTTPGFKSWQDPEAYRREPKSTTNPMMRVTKACTYDLSYWQRLRRWLLHPASSKPRKRTMADEDKPTQDAGPRCGHLQHRNVERSPN